jgi:anthranilate synthase/aminodeoxychorismate synthase-like glutamine amidotransferase
MSRDPNVLLIDNFDSFTFNLVDAFARLGANVEVYRNDIGADAALAIVAHRDIDLVVLSPGPGTPESAGCCVDLVRGAAGRVPLFGVCLGHQAIAAAYGAPVVRAADVVHGKKSVVRHAGHALFSGFEPSFEVGRYHSLAATGLVAPLEAIAESDGIVMALAHREAPLWGVQFHPESILTTHGQRLLRNVLDLSTIQRREIAACMPG